ncbi:ATP-binding protein [Denitromonas iodatirespirans]|uniref:ATP-binding protein n=1 Tax=Denitromonas iodatirespirans TaxID=2795389 RepID=A0A944DEB0_DENI1|nr:ATP-binding protein [Denitromonas iodatirespirans]MBT0962878.1 ATP-binding protein [Denitromonas iodatirespirans]
MTPTAPDLAAFFTRLEKTLDRLDAWLPGPPEAPDWDSAIAFRWLRRGAHARLEAIPHPHLIRVEDLQDVDDQVERLDANTRQFVKGRRANNALLTGARGTGKSSLVKAMLARYADKGLRLIEVDKQDLMDLPEIVELVRNRRERFVLFCDDLSFEDAEPAYKALKSVLDGSLAAVPDNVIIYATSNRRHLMPEYHAENREARNIDGEIHPGEAVEEKVSLSERFGLWLSFYPFSQDAYLDIVAHWLAEFGVSPAKIDKARTDALQWALMRGSRSGRVAWQFARDYAGRHGK